MFDPALQAFIGKQIPYERRGKVIGIVEISWAGSSLVGIPLIGLLIGAFSAGAPLSLLLVDWVCSAPFGFGYVDSRSPKKCSGTSPTASFF